MANSFNTFDGAGRRETSVFGTKNSLDISAGNLFEDAMDWFGLGTARRNQAFQSLEAEDQRNWQEHMSNTAVQRQVADMEKAGINPAMAFANNASGASTPSGAMAHANSAGGQAGSIINAVANVARVMNSDKDPRNNMNAAGVTKFVTNIAKVFVHE